jgi:regulator of protease activity HflC (stomatin/prohibitin superfamily)
MEFIFIYLLVFFVIFIFFKLVRIVPEQEADVVEQFGKYQKTLGAGLHLVIPFVQKIAYKHLLKEQVIDVPPQICITNDNVQVTVDGLLYLKVMDPQKASYGIENYRFATSQLAQTTMRSEIGKMELDRSFSERDELNDAIVKALDLASNPWGIKVTRYEIKDISPTDTILEAMEQQMRAERERRAEILISEGDKESRINVSVGEREGAINVSKGERQRRINVSDGRAQAMKITAQATADGIATVAEAIRMPKGRSAMTLRLTQQYIEQLATIFETADVSVLPWDLAQFKSVINTLLTPEKERASGVISAGAGGTLAPEGGEA